MTGKIITEKITHTKKVQRMGPRKKRSKGYGQLKFLLEGEFRCAGHILRLASKT
jgi:hypothetical protein